VGGGGQCQLWPSDRALVGLLRLIVGTLRLRRTVDGVTHRWLVSFIRLGSEADGPGVDDSLFSFSPVLFARLWHFQASRTVRSPLVCVCPRPRMIRPNRPLCVLHASCRIQPGPFPPDTNLNAAMGMMRCAYAHCFLRSRGEHELNTRTHRKQSVSQALSQAFWACAAWLFAGRRVAFID